MTPRSRSTARTSLSKTDEIDVIAYVKVLIAKGAKVQMYSMHDHDSGFGGQ